MKDNTNGLKEVFAQEKKGKENAHAIISESGLFLTLGLVTSVAWYKNVRPLFNTLTYFQLVGNMVPLFFFSKNSLDAIYVLSKEKGGENWEKSCGNKNIWDEKKNKKEQNFAAQENILIHMENENGEEMKKIFVFDEVKDTERRKLQFLKIPSLLEDFWKFVGLQYDSNNDNRNNLLSSSQTTGTYSNQTYLVSISSSGRNHFHILSNW